MDGWKDRSVMEMLGLTAPVQRARDRIDGDASFVVGSIDRSMPDISFFFFFSFLPLSLLCTCTQTRHWMSRGIFLIFFFIFFLAFPINQSNSVTSAHTYIPQTGWVIPINQTPRIITTAKAIFISPKDAFPHSPTHTKPNQPKPTQKHHQNINLYA